MELIVVAFGNSLAGKTTPCDAKVVGKLLRIKGSRAPDRQKLPKSAWGVTELGQTLGEAPKRPEIPDLTREREMNRR